MKKKIAIILELIPIISCIISFILIYSRFDSNNLMFIKTIAMIISFFGFVFFIIGNILVKKDKLVLLLGILDIITTIFVIGFYIIVIFLFGL